MSYEIVRKLRDANRNKILKEELLSESFLREAEEDEEEDLEMDAPEDAVEDEEEEPIKRTILKRPDDGGEEDFEEEPETPVEDEPEETEDTSDEAEDDVEKSVNPLDNPYAVNHQIGDKVAISYLNGTKSDLHGTIEGYDKEGFYRIKWAGGLTTNGITDVALASMVDKKNECVCGSTKFVNEGKSIVCDKCGRIITETVDPLTKADKARPKGKKLIRSEAHPMSTSLSEKTVQDTIRSAFKRSMNENDDSTSVFDNLTSELSNLFWTRKEEMLEDIRSLGYDVLEADAEYVIVETEDDEGEEYVLKIPVGGTSRTMTLDFDRAKEI